MAESSGFEESEELSELEIIQALGELFDVASGRLDLSGTDITGENLASLSPLAPFLHMLRLDDTDTASGLAHLTKLTELSAVLLSRVPFSDQSQFAPLADLPLLESLFLDGTGLTDEGLALFYSPRLKRLNISDNPGVTDVGICAMTGMQPGGTLFISGCTITKAAIEHVRRVLKPKRLAVGGPSIGSDEVDFLLTYNELEALIIGKDTDITGERQSDLVNTLTRTKVAFVD